MDWDYQSKLDALKRLTGQGPAPVGMGDVKEAESGVPRIDNPEDIPQEADLLRRTSDKEPDINDITAERQRLGGIIDQSMGMMGSVGNTGKIAKPIVEEVAPNVLRWGKTLVKKTALPIDEVAKRFRLQQILNMQK